MTRSDVDRIAIRGFWLLVVAAVVAVLLPGCSKAAQWSPVDPSSDVEGVLISETARFAGLHGVKVRGEITEKLSPAQAASGQNPTGWYEAGVAYYYRPMIAKYVTVEPTAGHETATNVAHHEVCHAVTGRAHDLAHWKCNGTFGSTATYPAP